MISQTEEATGNQEPDINNIPLFQDIPPAGLAQLLSKCTHSEMAKGDIVFQKGEESSCMSILLSGKVDLTLNNSSIATLEAPAIIGEIGFFSGKPRNATVKALTKIQILTMTQQSLFSLFENEPQLTHKIYRNLILGLRGKINKSNQQVLFLHKALKKREKEHSEFKNPSKSIKPVKNEKQIPSSVNSSAMDNQLSADVRRYARIAVPGENQCSVKINDVIYLVKNISLGGLSIILDESTEIEDDWDEGAEIKGELKAKNNPSFSFSGTVVNLLTDLCSMQFSKLDSSKQKLIQGVINSLHEPDQASQPA